MRVLVILALLSFGASAPAAESRLKVWWTHFCERHLATEDPWQWDHLPTAQVVQMYRQAGQSLHSGGPISDAYHMRALASQLRWRFNEASGDDKILINEAFDEYPVKFLPRW